LQSEVARILSQICAEYEAAQQGLAGLSSGTARHAFIIARMEQMSRLHTELRAVVGDDAMMLLDQQLDSLPETPEQLSPSAHQIAEPQEEMDLLAAGFDGSAWMCLVQEVTMPGETSVVDLLESAGTVASALAADRRLAGLRVVLLALQTGQDDPFARAVVTASKALLAHLRDTLADRAQDRRPLAVVVWVPSSSASPWEAAAWEACWQATRGVVGALTRERGAVEVRLNAVCAEEGMQGALAETLAFLASPEAAFVAGSSLDVRRAAV
jgi:hypothetical protein